MQNAQIGIASQHRAGSAIQSDGSQPPTQANGQLAQQIEQGRSPGRSLLVAGERAEIQTDQLLDLAARSDHAGARPGGAEIEAKTKLPAHLTGWRLPWKKMKRLVQGTY